MDLSLGFYFVPLIYISVFVQVPYCLDDCGFVVEPEARQADSSNLLSLFTFMHWRRKWQPTPVFLLENPRDGGAWGAAIYGVAQSLTRLK